MGGYRASATRQIGNTGVHVTQLGFGGAPLGNLYEPVTDEQANAAITGALRAGVRYFDTAPLYGYGLSEHRTGHALRLLARNEYVLSTKVGRLLRPVEPSRMSPGQFPDCLPFEGVFDYSYSGVMRSVEDSLQRLGLHRVDILLIHDVDIWTHGSQEAMEVRFREVMDDGYKALEKLRGEGTVQAIGCGVNEWQVCERFARAGDFDCFLLAGRYTLLEQEALVSCLPLCASKKISVIIGGPYNTGILATGAVENAYYNYGPAPPGILDRVRRIELSCAEYGVPLAAAALQFPLHHPVIAAVIPGARCDDEVKRNVALLEKGIPDPFWSDLKRNRLLSEEAPTP